MGQLYIVRNIAMSQTTLDHAYLADDAYKDRSQEAAAIDPEKRKVIVGGKAYEVIAYTSTLSGFQGTAYRDLENGEVVIAARGTEFDRELLRDVVLADGGMVAKSINHQTADAIAFARSVIQQQKDLVESKGEPAPRFTVVGHSLGGAHAQVISHHLGLPAETFNAYGAAELQSMAGPPAPGARVINHVDAADFVSAASHHFGEVRVYATEQDIAHLRARSYGPAPLIPPLPLPPVAAAMAGRVNAMADAITGPSTAVAFSAHSANAHRMTTMAPEHGDSLLTESNRQRYQQHRPLVDAYRHGLRELRSDVSEQAQAWPRAVDAMGATVRQISANVELAATTWQAANQHRRHKAEQEIEANQQLRQGIAQATDDAGHNSEDENMKTLHLAAVAVLAASTTLAACGPAENLQESNAMYKQNPDPKQRYDITMSIANAPGPFASILVSAQYQADDCWYTVDRFAGVNANPTDILSITLTKTNETTYAGTVYLDAMQDGDYHGTGICHWELTSIGASLKATGSPGEARFVSSLSSEKLRAEQAETTYLRKVFYPRDPDIENLPVSGQTDRSKIDPSISDDDLFTITFTPKAVTP